jgi:HlyD family secretion protein
MDIVKKKPEAGPLKRKLPIVIVAFSILVLSGWTIAHSGSTPRISRSAILLGKVKNGDLDVLIEGYGNLRSEKQKLLTTSTGGSVEELMLKPGAAVTPDSVIMQLRNPEVEHRMLEEQQKLEKEKTSLRELGLSQQVDMLGERAKLDEEQTKYQSAKLTRDEQQQWADKGVISKLTFRETQLKEALLEKSVEACKNRIQQLQLVHNEELKIQQEKIRAQEAVYKDAEEQFRNLNIRAGIAGVLQSVSVELGQSLTAGQRLAQVGSTQDLVALIKVPQSSAERIRSGQQAIIDTHQDKINGHVTQVDPTVQNGTVQVEIALNDKLPPSALPELNVDATIIADRLKSVLYVEKPANAHANSTAKIFRLEGNKADSAQITFGADAGRFIQVTGNTKVGDTFVLSDMQKYQNSSEVIMDD